MHVAKPKTAQRSVGLAVAALALLLGCTAGDAGRAPPPPRVSPSVDPQLHEMTLRAKEDLRRRLGLSPNQDIQTISSQVVSWPNAAIGCPQPGHSYTQAIVTGARAEFRHAGASYYYHGRGLQPLALCEKGARSPLPKLPQPGNRIPQSR